MSRKANEALLDAIGAVDERYIQEYVEMQEQKKKRRKQWYRMPFAAVAAIVAAAFLGTAGVAAFVPMIGSFRESRENDSRAVIRNFDEIEKAYAVQIGDVQKCCGVTATLNSAIVEDHHLLLRYTFDWSELEEARDGSFHTWFLPWFFYIAEGENVICSSEYTKELHTQNYLAEDGDNFTRMTLLYNIELENIKGEDLLGKELTVRLLYAEGGEGFCSTFVPKDCYADRYWEIQKKYKFGEDEIVLKGVQETALYVVLFIEHNTDYTFVLADEQGKNYTLYPYDDNKTDGYWFVKPENAGGGLILKVVRRLQADAAGELAGDGFEVVYEIPIRFKESFFSWFSYNTLLPIPPAT